MSLAPAALWVALAVGVTWDVPPAGRDEPVVDSKQIVACESGGMNSDTCSINCHVIFNFYTTSCEVTCRSGFFACCNCSSGCQCVIDHEEMYPLPPRDPTPKDLP